MIPLVLASLLAPLACASKVPDLLRDQPRLDFAVRGGHLLPREAESFKVEVQAIEAVQWKVRPVDPAGFDPTGDDGEGGDEGESELEESDISSLLEPSRGQGRTFGTFADPVLERRSSGTSGQGGTVRRPAGALSRWSFRLDLERIQRRHPGKLLSLEVTASPGDLLPPMDPDRCEPVRLSDVFLVSRLGLHATSTGKDSLEILAIDLQSGRPWPGVVLRSIGAGDPIRGKTGPSGWIRLPKPEGGHRWLGLAGRSDAAVLQAREESSWSQSLEVNVFEGTESVGQSMENGWRGSSPFPDGVRIHPYLLRGVHAPGDSVVAGFIVRGPGGAIPAGRTFLARLCRQGACVDSTVVPVDRKGHVQWRFALAESSTRTGDWKIQAVQGSHVAETRFRVEEFQPPRMQLESRILTARDDSGRCQVELAARWLSGRPAAGHPFRAKLRGRSRHAAESSRKLQGSLDEWGRVSVPLERDSFGDLAWNVEFSVEEAAGRTVRTGFDGLKCPAIAARAVPAVATLGPTGDAEDGESEESEDESGTSTDPTPVRVRPGETVTTRWEAESDGLALLQVVQGDRILRRRVVPVSRGRQTWSEKSDSTWTPRVNLVVSVFGAGFDSARWVRAGGRVVEVDPPETPLEISLTVDSVFAPRSTARATLRNASRRKASVVVSAVDEGILSMDGFRPNEPSDWFSTPEPLAVSWWDALGRRDRPYSRRTSGGCAMSDGLLGEAGWGGIGGVGGGDRLMGVGGFGLGASSSMSDFETGGGGRRGSVSPGARRFAWTSAVLELPSGETTIAFPIGDYTGALRIFAMAVSGMRTRLLETGVPVRSPVELKLTAPMAVSPGDSFEVAATPLVGKGREVYVELAVEGPATDRPVPGPQADATSRAHPERRLLVAHDSTGEAAVFALAVSGTDSARDQDIVRIADDRSLASLSVSGRVEPKAELPLSLGAHFLPGSPPARLELTSGPVVGLDKLWQGLVAYPHGCLEQTLTKAMPQLYLESLYPQMGSRARDSASAYLQRAVEKMGRFQNSDGLMSLWPGEGRFHPMGSLWAMDFLQEVHRLHPTENQGTRERLERALRSARMPDPFQEAYRLAIVSDAFPRGSARLGRHLDSLQELDSSATMSWMLARAGRTQSHPSGRWHERARAGFGASVREFRRGMQSSVSARAMALQAAALLGDTAMVDSLLPLVGEDVSSPSWKSTFDLGSQLRALASVGWTRTIDTTVRPSISMDGGTWREVDLRSGRAVVEVPDATDTLRVRVAGGSRTVRAMLHRMGRVEGRAARPSAGLSLEVEHRPDTTLQEGVEDSVVFRVRNLTETHQDDLAATLWMPGGWQVPLDRIAPLRERFREADIRADRVVFHFRLAKGESRRISLPILARNAGGYRGARLDFEALYDARLFDSWEGPRIRVERPTR